MNQLLILSDYELETKIQDLTLDPSLFNHEEHLRLAWIHISKYGLEKAETNVTQQLRNFVTSLDSAEKYNETLTIAAIRIVHLFMQFTSENTFENLIQTHPKLLTDFKDLIAAHYSGNIYESKKAKLAFIEPDLLPIE